MAFATIRSSELEISINTFGAELDSVKDTSGKEYIYQGEVNGWKGKCPNLFPITGSVPCGKYKYNGKEYRMNQHGFARDMEFEIESKSEDSATFLLKSNDVSRAQYPFEFEFRITYRVSGRKLIVDFKTENKTDGKMYYSAGSHEGYLIKGNISDYSIVLDEPETLSGYVAVEDVGHTEETTSFLKNSREFRLCDELFIEDAIVFLDMKSRGLALRDDRDGSFIHVAFPGFDTLLVWKSPGAEFVCIEPWAGSGNLSWKRFSDFSEKYRIRTLEKGGSETLTHTITF